MLKTLQGKNNNPMDLRSDPIPQLIRSIALPASLGMLFSVLLNVVDTFYAGILSSTALAALSLAGPVFFLVMTLGIGVGQATNALVGNELGAGNPTKARQLAFQSISFAIVVSSIGALLAFWQLDFLFAIMGGEAPYLEPATQYLVIVLVGSALFSLSIVINSILNTRGDTKSYRNAQFVGLIANVFLDPLFMFVMGMGVVGVAVATIIVQFGVVVYLWRKAIKLDFMRGAKASELIPRLSFYKEIAKQSIPTSISMLLVAVGSVVIVAFVSRFGESAMAAYGVALRIEQLILLPVIGINIAALSLTGVNYGASQLDRVREIYIKGTLYAFLLMTSGAVVILIFGRQVMQLFSDDPNVVDIGTNYLNFEAFILPAYAITFLSAAVLQGLKKPLYALYCNIGRQVVGQLVLFYIAIDILELGINGVWISVLLINWIMAFVIYYLVKRRMQQLVPQNATAAFN